MVPLSEQIGFSRTGKKGGPFIDSLNHRSYTKAYVSSETDINLLLKLELDVTERAHVLMYYLMKLMQHKLNKK
ncbi:hypothetical protein ACV56Z_10105 [Staphylococcus aureus]